MAVRVSVSKFDDPHAFQAAVKPAQVEILVTTKGDFDAELNRIVFPRLWAQRGRENLPRVANSTVSLDRPPIFFLADADQASIRHCGRDLDLVHSVLVQTAPGSGTVTKIATDAGFWELGRFAVEYGALFGEAPSARLRRPAEERRKSQNNPFAFADSEYVPTSMH